MTRPEALPVSTSHLGKTVEAIYKMHFEGNIIPQSWFQHPKLQTANGTPNLVAIILLSDLIYWYRPIIIRDESSGEITEARKKFRYHRVYKDYAIWGKNFGLTKRQVQDAVTFLVKAGLIIREVTPFQFENGVIVGTVVFLEPIPAKIAEVTYNVRGVTFNSDPPSVQTETPSRSAATGVASDRDPYTETSTEVSAKTSTSLQQQAKPDAVVDDFKNAESPHPAGTAPTELPGTDVEADAAIYRRIDNLARRLVEVGVPEPIAAQTARGLDVARLDGPELVAALVRERVGKSAAAALIRPARQEPGPDAPQVDPHAGADEARWQLVLWPSRQRAMEIKNKGATLAKSIREQWGPPDRFIDELLWEAQNAVSKAQQEEQQQARVEQEARDREDYLQEAQRRRALANAMWDSYQKLTPGQQTALHQRLRNDKKRDFVAVNVEKRGGFAALQPGSVMWVDYLCAAAESLEVVTNGHNSGEGLPISHLIPDSEPATESASDDERKRLVTDALSRLTTRVVSRAAELDDLDAHQDSVGAELTDDEWAQVVADVRRMYRKAA